MNKTYYFHGYLLDGFRFTVSGEFYDNELNLGVALCGKKSNFSKKRGRTISTNRLNKGIECKGTYTFIKPSGREDLKFFHEICSGFESLNEPEFKEMFGLKDNHKN